MAKHNDTWKLHIEVVYINDVKTIQKKINQWMTAGTYGKHRVISTGTGPMIYEISLRK